jgi:hypothetical protein
VFVGCSDTVPPDSVGLGVAVGGHDGPMGGTVQVGSIRRIFSLLPNT